MRMGNFNPKVVTYLFIDKNLIREKINYLFVHIVFIYGFI